MFHYQGGLVSSHVAVAEVHVSVVSSVHVRVRVERVSRSAHSVASAHHSAVSAVGRDVGIRVD